jgi:hypothetical protein
MGKFENERFLWYSSVPWYFDLLAQCLRTGMQEALRALKLSADLLVE